MNHRIICGKSEIELKQFDDNTFDSCVCDPPYNLTSILKRFQNSNTENEHYAMNANHGYGRLLRGSVGGFMGKEWDGTGIPFKVELWEELYRIVKPGAHILVAGIARTHHRMWVALEDAGFDIIDGVYHIFGSGFPKSLDISKKIDNMAGEEREVIGASYIRNGKDGTNNETFKQAKRETTFITAPATEEAKQFEGFGTALKPAVEIWCLARKPISERNIASNVLRWGVGGINVAGCRIGNNTWEKLDGEHSGSERGHIQQIANRSAGVLRQSKTQGRFPSNLLLECCCEDNELVEVDDPSHPGQYKNITNPNTIFGVGTDEINKDRVTCEKGNKCLIHTNPACVCRMLDDQSGETKSTDNIRHNNQSDISGKKGSYGKFNNKDTQGFLDTGGASRFFYQAKASQNERWFYCTICKKAYPMKERDKHIHGAPEETKYKYLEFHPTQKPESLLCYLMRLVTPPGGAVIDPFLGSDTAIIAAEREGFNCVGIDSKPEYCEMAFRRGKSELIQQKITGTPSTIEKEGF